MLGMKTYSQDYIDVCQARVDANFQAYRESAVQAVRGSLFHDQVLLLDQKFVHWLTGIEGKDGNPLNEVRVIFIDLRQFFHT